MTPSKRVFGVLRGFPTISTVFGGRSPAIGIRYGMKERILPETRPSRGRLHRQPNGNCASAMVINAGGGFEMNT